MTRVAVLISGRGSNLASLITAAAAPSYPATIAAVATDKPDAPGLAHAANAGIPTHPLDRAGLGRQAFEASLHDTLAADADLIALAGFMRILSAEFVARWKGRILNIHPSLLPAFKGLNTHQRALDAGVKLHGATVHVVTPELDDGPILAQTAVPVRAGDTAEALRRRVLAAEHVLYPAALASHVTGAPCTAPLFVDG